MLYDLGDSRPRMQGDQFYVAPGAAVIGDVRLGADASVWFAAVLRGDNEPISIGERTNIQDGCVLHTDPGYPLNIAEEVTVGHMAMLHGCTIHRHCLIGIGAVILNGAVIGEGCLIGARTLIAEGKEIPPGKMVVGTPGKIIGDVTDEHRKRIARGVQSYVDKIARYRAGLSARAGK